MSACVAAWGDEPWAAKIQQAYSRALVDGRDRYPAIDDGQVKIWIVVLILVIPLVGLGYATPDQALQILSLFVVLLHR
ncbi:hypothetical protein ABZ723_04370 [Streptomyces sp. NPDC006700]|uniref:hypothetical protein n=1 Tax=Streptomyces sp. NPDC006700 TaxID=3154479 RepID=UPI0034082D80